MVEIGTYEELLQSSLSFNRLFENIHQQEKKQEEHEQEHEDSFDIRQRRLTRSITVVENDHEEVLLTNPGSSEAKEEGSVKWNVYIAYLRAGVGLIFGVIVSILIFGLREGVNVFYSWWLEKWSDEENYRYRQLNNCTKAVNNKVNIIRSMNETEWNNYRNHRFHFYCGRLMCSIFFSFLLFLYSYFFIGIALFLVILSLFRIVSTKLICLNSGRILHNK